MITKQAANWSGLIWKEFQCLFRNIEKILRTDYMQDEYIDYIYIINIHFNSQGHVTSYVLITVLNMFKTSLNVVQ